MNCFLAVLEDKCVVLEDLVIHFTIFGKYFEGLTEVLLTFVLIISSSDVAFHKSQTWQTLSSPKIGILEAVKPEQNTLTITIQICICKNNLHFLREKFATLVVVRSSQPWKYFKFLETSMLLVRPRCWCAAVASADSGECNDPGHIGLTATSNIFLSLVTGH